MPDQQQRFGSRCAICEQTKADALFNVNDPYCRPCRSVYSKVYRHGGGATEARSVVRGLLTVEDVANGKRAPKMRKVVSYV